MVKLNLLHQQEIISSLNNNDISIIGNNGIYIYKNIISYNNNKLKFYFINDNITIYKNVNILSYGINGNIDFISLTSSTLSLSLLNGSGC